MIVSEQYGSSIARPQIEETAVDLEQHVTRTQALKANPIAEPDWPKFTGQFFGGALFGVLLLVLIRWVWFLGLMIWRAVWSLFG